MLAKVRDIVPLLEGSFSMILEADLPHAAPGRFVHIAIPGSVLRRPISLCGYQDGLARICFAVKGEGTRWLATRRPGDTLDILGALGNGFPHSDLPTLLVGGGIGLPPLLYYAKEHPDLCHTLAGFRDAAAVLLTEEFETIEVFTNDGSYGQKGFPVDVLKARLGLGRYRRVLTCGPLPLMRRTAEICREVRMPCFVSMEQRMGCGVGACLVCSCKVAGEYRRACCDGPVFSGEEVDFS